MCEKFMTFTSYLLMPTFRMRMIYLDMKTGIVYTLHMVFVININICEHFRHVHMS